MESALSFKSVLHFFFYVSIKVVPGICMSLAGAIVLGQEKAYTAISSVDIQSAPILLLVAGILSILVTGIYFKKREWTWNDILIALRVVSSIYAFFTVTGLPSIFQVS